MQADDDSLLAMCFPHRAPEMGCAAILGAAAQHRSRGLRSDTLAWLVDRPSKRQRGARTRQSRLSGNDLGWWNDLAKRPGRPGHD
jgi:hypothetical protein